MTTANAPEDASFGCFLGWGGFVLFSSDKKKRDASQHLRGNGMAAMVFLVTVDECERNKTQGSPRCVTDKAFRLRQQPYLGVRFCAPVRTPGTQQPVTGHRASSFRKWAYSRRFHPSRVRSVTIPGNKLSQLHNCRIGGCLIDSGADL